MNGALFVPDASFPFQAGQEYRVVLKGDLIRDMVNQRGVDANHLPPWLPTRPTGNGTEGGGVRWAERIRRIEEPVVKSHQTKRLA